MKDRPSTSSAGAEGGLGLVAGCDEGEGQELATGLVTEWQWGSWKGTIGNWSSCGSEGWPPRPPHTVSFLLSPSMAFLSTEHSMPPQRRTGEGDLPPSTRIQRAETCVYITFSPTLQDQTSLPSPAQASWLTSRSNMMWSWRTSLETCRYLDPGHAEFFGKQSLGSGSWSGLQEMSL